MHLYIAGDAKVQVGDGVPEALLQTDFLSGEWQNPLSQVQADTDREITLALRIPGWAEHYTLRLNGQELAPDKVEKGYAYLTRPWAEAAELEAEFDMQPRFMCANRKIHYDLGRTAIVRGPVVYCVEEVDNGKYLDKLVGYLRWP